MESLDEYVLALAIGLPIVLVAAANVFLALTGERGTLLLPSQPALPDAQAEPPEGSERPATGPNP